MTVRPSVPAQRPVSDVSGITGLLGLGALAVEIEELEMRSEEAGVERDCFAEGGDGAGIVAGLFQ